MVGSYDVILRNKEYFYFSKYINVLTKSQIYKCCKGGGGIFGKLRIYVRVNNNVFFYYIFLITSSYPIICLSHRSLSLSESVGQKGGGGMHPS